MAVAAVNRDRRVAAGRSVDASLRVALVIDDLSVGGAQRGLTEEVHALIQRGHQCHVIVLADQPGLSFDEDLTRWGATIHDVHGAGLRDVGRLLRLVALFRRLKPHVVHTYLEYGNILGVVAAKLARRPVIASMRSTSTLQTRLDGPKRLLQGLVLRWGADRVVVVAAAALQESKQNMNLPASRTVVLPNAVDLDRLSLPNDFDRSAKRAELGASDDTPLVCVTARLDPVKGHSYLVSAVAQLKNRHPSARYLLVGAGSEGDRDEERRIRVQMHELGVSQQFALMGERFDVAEIVTASDLFVLPSLAEGLSRSLLEAMALGTPVVATAVGGNADVLSSGRTGWSIPPADPAALANAIDEALSQPERRQQMAAAANELVRDEYSVGPHAQRLESLYYSALKGYRALGA